MTINRDYTETHRVRPGRLAARLRVNVLLVISGQLLGRSVPPPPPPTPPPLLRLFLILCPSFRTPLSPSLSLSFSSTWSRFLPRCLDVRSVSSSTIPFQRRSLLSRFCPLCCSTVVVLEDIFSDRRASLNPDHSPFRSFRRDFEICMPIRE